MAMERPTAGSEYDDSGSMASSSFADITSTCTQGSASMNTALDSLDDYIASHYPDFTFAPMVHADDGGDSRLGSITDLPPAVVQPLWRWVLYGRCGLYGQYRELLGVWGDNRKDAAKKRRAIEIS
ncbi:hypothetical protein DOTSEDRAFT_18947 [Dothistroma septosporum NZE10]|uniref:Uncharacterized protein n=1 Tax=Dothistroma septosporum (strain NZE10 / CBS 128990) TaxID=675120 RepID=N1PY07_DOTSN|nr:hypothetical protein DOTSEDRAFT_18947 [Dothistroma septosporum NZE10]